MDEDHLFLFFAPEWRDMPAPQQVWDMLHAGVDRPAACGWNPAIEAHHPVLVLALFRGM